MNVFNNETELATLAHTIKTNKSQAFEAIKKIGLENLDDDEMQTAISRVYAYFLPKPTAKTKSDFAWTSRAQGFKDVRTYLNQPYSDGKTFVATDGSRMHLIRNKSLDAGFYNSNETLLSADHGLGCFPDFERVIPKHKQSVKLSDVQYGDIQPIRNTKKAFSIKLHLSPDVTIEINRRYLNEALSGLGDNPEIRFNSNVEPIHIIDGDKEVVIMPILPPKEGA